MKVIQSLGQALFFVALTAGMAGAALAQSGTLGSEVESKANSKTLPRAVMLDQENLSQIPLTTLSSNFVDRIIHDLSVDKHLTIFKKLDPETLDAALDTQAKQLTFWLNIYNGYTQYFLKTDPALYLNKRAEFFAKDQIAIAGYQVSMEDIEHGVLRRGAVVYSLGYIRFLSFRGDFIQTFAVNEVDYRIHFALNCGALSCPPVMVYQLATLNDQLDNNSRYYLQKEVRYQPAEDIALVPALLTWFSSDFTRGEQTKLGILKKHGALPADAAPKLKALPYDWSIDIQNYRAYKNK